MTGLRLGPLLRYVDEHSATVWVETDGPCEAEVRCAGGTEGARAAGGPPGTGGAPLAEAAAPGGTAPPAAPGGTARSWRVGGHHYALVTVTGLAPESTTPYRVLLDGRQVWPPPGGGEPAPVIRTLPRPGDRKSVV